MAAGRVLNIETFTPRLFQGVDLQLGVLGRPAGSARALSCSEILRFKNKNCTDRVVPLPQ